MTKSHLTPLKYSLHIPVSPFQRRLLVYYLGEKWVLTTREWLGQILVSYMGRTNRIPKTSPKDGLYYTIDIPSKYIRENGLNHIDDKRIGSFLYCIEDRFLKELFAFNDSLVLVRTKAGQGKIKNYGLELKQGITAFCKKFNINEEEMPYETIKKAYYRHRVRTESAVVLSKTNYYPHLSPQP